MFDYVNRAKQLFEFDGLPKGATDIDAFTDYGGKYFVFYEVKHRDAPCPLGQQIALEHLVKLAKEANRKAIALIVEHDVDDTGKNVPVKDCKVRAMYASGELKWRPPRTNALTAGELADAYFKHYEGKRNNVVRMQNRIQERRI